MRQSVALAHYIKTGVGLMGFFDWMRKPAEADPIYSVMNDDHVHLYKILGELRQVSARRGDDHVTRDQKLKSTLEIMQRLVKEARDHFQREEALMEGANYPETAAHKRDHLMLLRSVEVYYSKVATCTVPVTEDISQYLKSWLTNHIRHADRLLERFLFSAHKNRDTHDQMALDSADMGKFLAMVAAAKPGRLAPLKR